MLSFKSMISIEFFLRLKVLFLGLSLLAGCSLPSPGKREGDTAASFYIDSSAGEFTDTKSMSKLSLAKEKSLSFRACLKENSRSKPVISHAFIVKTPQGDQRTATDLSGCLTWSESITFNPLATHRNILLQRALVASGTQTGTRQAQFSVNPWSGKVLSLISNKVENLTAASEEKQTLNSSSTARLRFNPILSSMTSQRLTAEGSEVRLEVRGQIVIESINESGEKVLSPPLTQGQINTQVSLINLRRDSTRHLITQSPRRSLQIQGDGTLSATIDFLSSPANCPNGRIEVGVSIQAKDDDLSSLNFEGLFVGPHCQTNGNTALVAQSEFAERFQSQPNFGVQAFVEKETASLATQNHSANQDGLGGSVAIQRLDFSTTQIVGEGFDRRRHLNVSTCLEAATDFDALRREVFTIQKLNGESTQRRADIRGCISWEDSVELNYFEPECWKQGSVTISHQGLKLSQRIPVTYNPLATFDNFRDARYLDRNHQNRSCADGKSELLATSFEFGRQAVRFEVDPSLNAKVTKVGPLRIPLRLKRPSLTDISGFADDVAPVGTYLLRLAIVDARVQDVASAQGQIYHYTEKISQILGSSALIEDVEIASKNIKGIGNTNKIILEVIPLDQRRLSLLSNEQAIQAALPKDMVRPLVFRGAFTLQQAVESQNLIQDPGFPSGSMDQLKALYHEDQKRYEERMAHLKTPESYALQHKLTLIDVTKSQDTIGFRRSLSLPYAAQREANTSRRQHQVLSEEALKSYVAKGLDEEALQRLCLYWFGDLWSRPLPGKNHGVFSEFGIQSFHAIQECQSMVKKNPHLVFDLDTLYFVKKFKARSHAVQGRSRSFSVSQGFSISRGQSDSTSQSWSRDVSAGLKLPDIPFIPLFSASLGTSWSLSRSQSESTSQGTDLSFGNGTSFNVETVQVPLDVEEAQKCLAVKLNTQLFIDKTSTLWERGRESWLRRMNPRLSSAEKIHYGTVGILLCDSQTPVKDKSFNENYYAVQARTEGSTLDGQVEEFRPYFIAVRGNRDFVSLLSYLHLSAQAPSSFEREYQTSTLVADPILPVFMRGFPASPGVLSRPEEALFKKAETP